MARRITVSVPDMLHEKMEKWRQSFNMSKLFQDAIAEAIRKKEEFQKRIHRDLDLSEIIERLRTEKAESEGNFQDSGKVAGLEWAQSAHYTDLVYAVNWQPSGAALKDELLGPYFSEKLGNLNPGPNAAGSLGDPALAFLDGWHRGVQEFWAAVKDKL